MECTCHMSNIVDAANLDGVFLMYQMPFHPHTNSASPLPVEMTDRKCHAVGDDSVVPGRTCFWESEADQMEMGQKRRRRGKAGEN